jgi:hypothetical protein
MAENATGTIWDAFRMYDSNLIFRFYTTDVVYELV